MIDLLREMLAANVTQEAVGQELARHGTGLTPDELRDLTAVVVPFVHGLADGLAYAISLSKDPRCGRAVAHGTGSVLLYLVDDDDLLPESTFGATGLLDDAFLVHAFVARVRETFPYVPEPTGYRPPPPGDVDVVAALLPSGVAAALTSTCRSMVTVAAALFAAPGLVESAEPPVAPVLRVRQGLVLTTVGVRDSDKTD